MLNFLSGDNALLELPLAIFAYNRPNSLRRLLDSLASCEGFDRAHVHIFIDGPRSSQDEVLVQETQNIAFAAACDNWTVRVATKNQGLKQSIASGVSEVCSKYGRVIVLEDDLVLSPLALRYFEDGLDKYADDPRVWNICGYMFDSPELSKRGDCFFLPYSNPWGWATWQRAWSQFTLGGMMVSKEVMKSSSFKTYFDVAGLYAQSHMLDLSQNNLISSWYIQWYLQMFKQGGISLFPSMSYVENRGVGRGGEHSGKLNPFRLLRSDKKELTKILLEMPTEVEVDFRALDLATMSQELRVHRFIAQLGRMKRILRSRFF